MYALAEGGTLARRLWPGILTAHLPVDPKMSDLAPWQTVPTSYDDLCAWAMVERSEEGIKTVRPFLLLYAPEIGPSEAERVKVTLRIYGIVDSLNISPTGNYGGCVEHRT